MYSTQAFVISGRSIELAETCSVSFNVLKITLLSVARLRHTNHVRKMFNFKHNFKFPFWSKIRMCVRTRVGKDGQYFSDPERKLGQAAQVARMHIAVSS